MHRFLPAHCLLAAAALLAAAPAQAHTSTSVTLADFQISLTDLDPSDGVAPSIMFDPQLRSTVLVGYPVVDPFVSRQGDSLFGPVSLSADLDGTGGSGSISGDAFGAGAVITSSAEGNNEYADGWSSATTTAPSFGQAEFVMGAKSQVTFSGNVSADWDASSTAAATVAFAELRLWRNVGDEQEFLGDDWVGAFYYGEGAPSGSMSGPLGLTVANDSDAPEVVDFFLIVMSNATDRQSIPSPVDEPAGAALLFVGVSTLLWRARRRIS